MEINNWKKYMISQIKNLIPENLQHPMENGNIIFDESAKNARLKHLQISGLESAIPINQDLISFPEKIFMEIDYKKTCDGVIIFEFEKKIEILIFDVKSSTSNSQTHPTKLKCGRNYFLYLANTLQIFKEINIIDAPCYYCVFVLKDNEKRITSYEREPISLNPDKPTYIYVEDNETISIRKILGRPLI